MASNCFIKLIHGTKHRLMKPHTPTQFNRLGKNLAIIRFARKITFDDISEGTGISIGNLSKYENDVTANPTMNTLILIARFLNVSLDYLIFAEIEVEVKEMVTLQSSIHGN